MFDFDREEDAATLADIASKNDACATEIICHALKTIAHNDLGKKPLYQPLESWLTPLLLNKGDNKTFNKAKTCSMSLLETTKEHVPLFENLDHHNLLNIEGVWKIEQEQTLIGDPCFNLSGFFASPHNSPDIWLSETRIQTLANRFGKELGLCPHRIVSFAYIRTACDLIGQKSLNREKYALAVKLSALLDS